MKIKKIISGILCLSVISSILCSPPVKADDSQWEEIQSIISSFSDKAVWTDQTYSGAISQTIPTTAILGNGNIGVTSYGSSQEKTYLLSSTDFWSDNAHHIGYMNRSPQILTGGSLNIKSADNAVSTDFSEHLDIAEAEIETNLTFDSSPLYINNFISAEKNIMITEITSESDSPVTLTVSPQSKNPDIDVTCCNPDFTISSGVSDNISWVTRKSNVNDEVYNGTTYTARWMSEFAIACKVINAENITTDKEIIFTVSPHKTSYIVSGINCIGNQSVTAAYGENGVALESAINLCNEITSEKDAENLKQSHREHWKDYYKLSYVDLGDTDLNRTYYGAQYIFGCCTKEGNTAPGLYGVWATTDKANWCGDYHLNYNFQAPYYGSYSSNRLYEYSAPMFDAILNYIDAAKERAANPEHLKAIHPWYFSTRPDLANGIEDAVLMPVGITPYDFSTDTKAYLNQTLNALFCASQIASYYQYTLDTDTLMKKHTTVNGTEYSMYDFLVLTANFYEKWVEKRNPRTDNIYIKDSKCLDDGYTQVHPTDYTANYEKYPQYDGGEDYTYVLFDGCHEGSFEFNPTVTLGNLQNLLDTLIEIGSKYAPSAEKYETWKDISSHLAKPDVSIYTYDGYNNASKSSPNKGKEIFGLSEDRKIRPISATVNLEFIHPGEQMSFDSDPHLLEVARNTVSVMGDDAVKYSGSGRGWASVNNTPKIFTQAARVGYDPNVLTSKIKQYVTSLMEKNYYVNDKTHGWEKTGITEAFNSMLLQEDNGIIKAFPNWDSSKNSSFSRLRAKGAYLVSSEIKNGNISYIEVTSEHQNTAKIVLPWENTLIKDESGKTIPFTRSTTKNTEEETAIFSVETGKKYTLTEDTSIPTVVSVEKEYISVDKNDVPILPTSVTVNLSDGSTKSLPVKWNSIDESKTKNDAVFAVEGTVVGTKKHAVCFVTVGNALLVAYDRFDDTNDLSQWHGYTDVSNSMAAENGTIEISNGSLNITKTSPTTAEYGFGARRTFHQEETIDSHTRLWTDQLRGTYDIELNGCTMSSPNGTLWLDFTGVYNTNATPRVTRIRADSQGFGPYNNNLNKIGSNNYVHSSIQTKTDYRIRFDMENKKYQIYINSSETPAQTINTSASPNNIFDMTDYSLRNSIEYMDGFLLNAMKSLTQDTKIMSLDEFKATRIKKYEDSTVSNAEKYLTIDKICDNPENVLQINSLPTEYNGATILWTSSNTSVIDNSGNIVAYPTEKTDVYMTAEIKDTENGYHEYKEFRLTLNGDNNNEIKITYNGDNVTSVDTVLGKTIDISSPLTNAATIVAAYKNGILVKCTVLDSSSAFTVPTDAETIKVMVWDGMNTMQPLIQSKTI